MNNCKVCKMCKQCIQDYIDDFVTVTPKWKDRKKRDESFYHLSCITIIEKGVK